MKTNHNEMSASDFRKNHVDRVEHAIQATFIAWFDRQYPGLLLFAIPNGGLRNKGVAGQMKAEGVRKGMPDLCLAVVTPIHPGLYIETKTLKGKLSDDQLIAHAYLRAQGYRVEVVYNIEEFMALINDYLSDLP